LDRVRGFRICIDFAEIPGALTKSAVLIYASPMLTGIVGGVKATFFSFDDCIHTVGIGTGNCHTDPSKDSFGETVSLEAFPSHAVVFRSIQPASGTAARKKPWLPSRL